MDAVQEEKIYTVEDIYALSEGQRAELIDGKMYMLAAPGRMHQRLSVEIVNKIYNYISSQQGSCEVYTAPFAVFLDIGKNYVEPDISVVCDKNKLTEKGCSGAPDWVIEIVSPSSRWMDYYKKIVLYRTSGVREYWIVDFEKIMVTVYNFEQENVNTYTFGEEIPVGIYPGFSLVI